LFKVEGCEELEATTNAIPGTGACLNLDREFFDLTSAVEVPCCKIMIPGLVRSLRTDAIESWQVFATRRERNGPEALSGQTQGNAIFAIFSQPAIVDHRLTLFHLMAETIMLL